MPTLLYLPPSHTHTHTGFGTLYGRTVIWSERRAAKKGQSDQGEVTLTL